MEWTGNNKPVPVTGDSLQQFSNITMEDAAARFISFLDVKPRTAQTYRNNLKQFVKWLHDHDIASPTREDVIAWRDELKQDHKPNTVQAYIIAVRLFFQWTEQEGIYPDIAKHIKGARIEPTYKKDYLTPEQAAMLLDQTDRHTEKGKRDYAMILLMLTGGLRDKEVSEANIGDIHVIGNCQVLYLKGKGRDEKEEYVKLTYETCNALIVYLESRKGITTAAPLFASTSHNNQGERMTTRSISSLIKGYLRSAGLDSPRLTAHSLRHTAITLSLINGCSLEEVQQFARHSSINTTMIYAHQLERINSKCENTIEKAIFTEREERRE